MYERRLRWLVSAFVVLFGVIGARAFALQVVDVGDHVQKYEDRTRRAFTVLPRRGEILFADGSPMARNEPGFGLEIAFADFDDRMLPTPDELAADFADDPTDDERVRAWRGDLVAELAGHQTRFMKDGPGVLWACLTCGDAVRAAVVPKDRCDGCRTGPDYVLTPQPDPVRLAELLEIPVRELRVAFVRALRRRKLRPNYRLHALLLRIPREAAEAIELRPHDFPGLIPVPRRARWHDPAARCLVGGVRLPTADDVADLTDDARADAGLHVYLRTEVYQTLVGSSLLERTFDEQLRGVPGLAHRVLLRRGEYAEQNVVEREVRDGDTLRTSIRPALQKRAMEIVEGAPENGHGSAVVMDVRTGAVVALASTERDGLIRALCRVQPGSVFKLVTAVALLEADFDPDEELICDGRGSVRGHGRYVCEHTHGAISFREAFQKSCNGYFGQQAARLGMEALASGMRRLGIETQLDLGLGRRRTSLAGLEYSGPGHATNPWHNNELMQIGIGQAQATASPLQIATAYARVASGGLGVTPWLLECDRPADVVVDPVLSRHASLLVEAARLVVTSGTGRKQAQLAAARAAGKSGTAEVRRDPKRDPGTSRFVNNAWFVGFAPFDSPRYVAVVVYERMPTGSHGAAIAGDFVGELLMAAERE